ncbi:hypothetical protein [Thalassotalea montiporae]
MKFTYQVCIKTINVHLLSKQLPKNNVQRNKVRRNNVPRNKALKDKALIDYEQDQAALWNPVRQT